MSEIESIDQSESIPRESPLLSANELTESLAAIATFIFTAVPLASPYIALEIVQNHVKELYSFGIPLAVICAILTDYIHSERQ